MKSIILLLVVVCLSSCASTKPHCPTYAQAPETTVHKGPMPNKLWVIAFVGVAAYIASQNLEHEKQDR